MKKRLFLCNGPTQIINVLTLISESKENYSDIHCVYGTFVNGNLNHPIYSAIDHLTRYHKWKKVVYFNGDYDEGFTNEYLYNLFDEKFFDEIFIIRNVGHFINYVLDTYRKAKIIVYGDGLGVLDIVIPQKILFKNRIDEARLILPVYYEDRYKEIKNMIPIKELDIIYTQKMIRSISENLNLEGLSKENGAKLYLTSYFSQIKRCSFNEEVNLYLQHILKKIHPLEGVCIKPHPRDSIGVANALYLKLRELGYNVSIITEEFSSFPVELLINFLDTKVIYMVSSASFYGIEKLYPNVKYELLTESNIQIGNESMKAFLKGGLGAYDPTTDKDVRKFKKVNLLQKRYDKMESELEKQFLKFFQEYSREKRKVYFYGAGSYLYEYDFIRKLEELGVDSISGIFDGSHIKAGNNFLNLPTLHSSEIEKKYTQNKKVYILITSSYSNEISKNLKEIGLIKNKDYYNFYLDFNNIL